MMRALTVAGLLLASPAVAQSAAPAVEARDTMYRFAKCIVARDKGQVAHMITLPVDSAEGVRVARRLFETTDETCLEEGAVDYNATLFRGAVFDALYARDFRYDGPTVFAAGVTTGYAARYTAPYSASAKAAIALEAFGECVARAEPVAARSLLLAVPGTIAERDQFATLTPRIAACVTQGSTVAMSKSIIRGALAEGMYRLSKVVGDAAMGGAK